MGLRDELLQVAAVAVAMIESIDNGGATGPPSQTAMIAQEVLWERGKQDRKWGSQRMHPHEKWLAILGEEYGECCRAVLERDC